MINKTLRRLAVGASAITVLGVVVPLAAATSASAATTPTLSVNPTTAYTTTSTPATFTVTPNPASPTYGVNYDIYSGPDSNTGAPFSGTPCTAVGGGTSYTCTITPGTTAGTDKIHFYEPQTATTDPYTAASPSVDGTLIVAGPVAAVTIAPTTAHQAQGVYQNYQVTVTDIGGRPVPGASVTVTGVQSNAANSDVTGSISNTSTARNTGFSGTDTASAAGTNGTVNKTETTGDGTATGANAEPVGQATFNLASKVTGTLNITAQFSAGITATATQTIDPGTANDVTSVALTPATANAFSGGTVTETATLKNAQGDLVGGVTPVGTVSGANAGATVLTSGATTGTGTATLSYTATNVGTDTLTGYVNQSDNPVNNGSLNPGEPSGTATITVTAKPTVTGGNDTNLTSSCDTPCQTPTTTTAVPVTFTLKDDSGNPIPGATITYTTGGTAATYTPASPLTTDSKGQVTITATNAAPKNADSETITATTTQFATPATDTATVTYFSATTVSTVTLQPKTQAATQGAKITETATATNAAGSPVSGATISFVVTGRNDTTNNLGATGTCTTAASGSCDFSYTDTGGAVTGSPTDTVTATDGSASDTAKVYYYTTAGQTAAALTLQINHTANTATTVQTCGGTNSESLNTGSGSTNFYTVCVNVKNNAPANIKGKTVTLSTSGVGGFVDSKGNAVSGNSETANADASGNAVFYIQSATAGTQNLTATADAVSATGTATYSNANYNPVAPQRLVDTRSGQGGVNTGPLAPNTNYTFCLGDTGFTPTNANAYVFNVTAIAPSSGGNLRIGPGKSTTPSTSLINYVQGQTSANGVIVPKDGATDGCFTLYSDGASANVAIDVTGYYLGGSFSATTPTRVADTRSGGGGTLAAGTTRVFQVAPASTSNTAIALNVTAIAPSARGYLQVFPDGAAQPTTSNINYVPGQTKAAFVVVQLPANGKIDVYTAGASVNVAIDVFGTYTATTPASLKTQAPVRIYDTRNGPGELINRQARSVQVTGEGGVPANAQAVLVSVTSIPAKDSTGAGNLRVFPTGQALPTVSTVNYNGTYPVANFAIVPIGTGGKIDLYSDGSNIDAAVDVLGYVPGS